jgi:hypothetical protein
MNKGYSRFPKLMILGIFMVAGVILCWVFRESIVHPVEKKTVVTDVATMMFDYKKSESIANAKYLEKTVVVTGTVESLIHLADEVTISLQEPNAMAGVLCYFPMNILDTSYLKIGSLVTVKGKCEGFFTDVLLSNCILQK